jgi:hypothetical protein
MIEPLESEVFESQNAPKSTIDWKLYTELKRLGIVHSEGDEIDIRSFNVGNSDYSKHIIQPWSIWIDWNLNAWDADIVKRVLRTKQGESRITDYEKIIHDCNERIRQLKNEKI